MNHDIFGPNQRRIILDFLKGDNGYSHNNGILQKVLKEFGHAISLEKTDEQIDWLKGQGLVTVEELGGNLKTVKLTMKGLDVAEGNDRLEGVERPAPE